MLHQRRGLSIAFSNCKINLKKKWSHIEFPINKCSILPLALKHKYPLADSCHVISFEYNTSNYLGYVGIAFRDQFIMIRNIDATSGWKKINIDFVDVKNIFQQELLRKGGMVYLNFVPFPCSESFIMKVRNIHLRCYTKDEKIKYHQRLDWKKHNVPKHNIESYIFNQNFPIQILEVAVFDQTIQISGISQLQCANICLCEIYLHEDISVNNIVINDILHNKESFSVTVDRFIQLGTTTYDRLYSRWILTINADNAYYICSHAKYANRIQNPIKSLIKPKPRNKKGLGSFSFIPDVNSDLDTLGISYITINICINDFLLLKPSKNCILFQYQNETYYVEKAIIEKYDKAIQQAAARNIIVAAIILVCPEERSKDKKVGRLLEYPAYNPAGAYSMPNLTSIESSKLYIAALNFLASRYNRSDGKYGRIHNWIVHNEVNSGSVWTNAGSKTLFDFIDIYMKSLRVTHLTVHKYDHSAEVFVSLDHYWQGKSEESGCYSSAEMLKSLLSYSKVEGDFKWGIAYHPYPEDLIDPKSWRDPNATFDLNTKLITFKNIEILDEWINKSETFFNGVEKRTLLLSEQNPNSIDYSENAINEQAASLAYIWKKVQACNGIDAYIAHSWIDARFEGGLKTGLRKYPDDPNDPYGEKKAWFVFKDAGTERENETFEFAKKIIGINSWDEIIKSY